VKAIVVTLLFMILAVVVIFNLTILAGQFWDFLEAFGREAWANVTGQY
jgi:hypothetical protein